MSGNTPVVAQNSDSIRFEWKKDANIMRFSTTTMGGQEDALTIHLNKMVEKSKDPDRAGFATEMEGFKQLFAQYKSSKGKTLEWEKNSTSTRTLGYSIF